MSARLNYIQHSPALVAQLGQLSALIKKTGLEASLLHLIFLRASQLNHCAFCVDMHVKEAKIGGERELRLHHVAVWAESNLFSPRERAALEWTESVTLISQTQVPDAAYTRVCEYFSEVEVSNLTFAIGLINFWNRLAVSFRAVPGSADRLYGLEKAALV